MARLEIGRGMVPVEDARMDRVPLDRDPVPPKYSEKTRRYYERLGSGK